MKRLAIYLIFFSALFGVLGFCFANDISTKTPLTNDKGVTVVDKVLDLNGGRLTLENNSTLLFKDGGMIKNGTVIGNNTFLKADSHVFDNVIISGTWKVPYITTDYFCDLSSDNSLQSLFALTSAETNNRVVIKEGEYWIATDSVNLTGVPIRSNTIVEIEGTIRLRPNREERSYIFGVEKCENVIITGGGIIIGDKDEHLGTKGQWGMGVAIFGSTNVQVSNLHISNCWGDCIYVAKDSKNVYVENCDLQNSRRQGISVVGCDGFFVKNSKISKVKGSLPEYGIDLEPNTNRIVQNVIIENVTIEDCQGGILTCGSAENAVVDDIHIINCFISIGDNDSHRALTSIDSKNVVLSNNRFLSNKRNSISLTNCSNYTFIHNEIKSISGIILKGCKNVAFNNNQISSQTYSFREMSGLNLTGNSISSKKLTEENSVINNLYLDSNELNCLIPDSFANSVIQNNTFLKKNKKIDKILIDNERNNIIVNNRYEPSL